MKPDFGNDRLRSLIPNVIHEVKGEATLADKLRPWLDTAWAWLERTVLGAGYTPGDGEARTWCERLTVARAFAAAVPSLDLTLSPAGFAVIDTDGRAPASKERVERLVSSLNAQADHLLALLVERLSAQPQWRAAPLGRWWTSTCITPADAAPLRKAHEPLLDVFTMVRAIALPYEEALGAQMLGRRFMESLRTSPHDGAGDVASMVHSAVMGHVHRSLGGVCRGVPGHDELWRAARPVISCLSRYPALRELWAAEMPHLADAAPFVNDVKGGYYF